MGFLTAETSVWYETLGSTSAVAILFLGDAFLVCVFNDYTRLLANAIIYRLKALPAVLDLPLSLLSDRISTFRIFGRVRYDTCSCSIYFF